ncbi:MAG: hypothetical protein ACJASQ_001023 [Crocinitomicaceae bacterium]|jgi:hypothetical protein
MCELIVVILLILKYRSATFELIFNKEKIKLSYEYRAHSAEFDYSELSEVHYRKPYRGTLTYLFLTRTVND